MPSKWETLKCRRKLTKSFIVSCQEIWGVTTYKVETLGIHLRQFSVMWQHSTWRIPSRLNNVVLGPITLPLMVREAEMAVTLFSKIFALEKPHYIVPIQRNHLPIRRTYSHLNYWQRISKYIEISMNLDNYQEIRDVNPTIIALKWKLFMLTPKGPPQCGSRPKVGTLSIPRRSCV